MSRSRKKNWKRVVFRYADPKRRNGEPGDEPTSRAEREEYAKRADAKR